MTYIHISANTIRMSANIRKLTVILEIVCKYLFLLELRISAFRGSCKTAPKMNHQKVRQASNGIRGSSGRYENNFDTDSQSRRPLS